MHEYIRLRKEVLGFDEQHMYDIYVPLVEDAEIKMPFEEAYELVIEGLAALEQDDTMLKLEASDGKKFVLAYNSLKKIYILNTTL